MDIQLYLASNSPRRKELLSLVKKEYNHLPIQVDETPLPDEEGLEYVQRIAASKARRAISQVQMKSVVIAADTTVLQCGMNGRMKILGKPTDSVEAAEMLRSLRGKVHQVITAVSIAYTGDGTMFGDYCVTDVPMRNYSEEEINAYVVSGDPLDKAGAYGIQHIGFHPVENLQGCYANVMGLPLCHLTRDMAQLGLRPKADVPQACQAALGYDCPVYGEILSEKNWEGSLISDQ